MAEYRHTPRPWTRGVCNEIRQGNHLLGEPFDRQRLIAICYPTNGTIEELEEMFANARLIAAAPDLLEACLSARDVIDPDEGPMARRLRAILDFAIQRAAS